METITYNFITEYNDGTKHEREFVFTSDTKIYAKVEHVSRSGMSRTMSFYMIEDGELINITHVVARVCGYKLNENSWTIRVQGCGMDMIFFVLNRFANVLKFKHKPVWVEHYGTI